MAGNVVFCCRDAEIWLDSFASRLLESEMRLLELESAVGQIKYDGGFKRFQYRGRKMVEADFATVAMAHNIKKLVSVKDAMRSSQAEESCRLRGARKKKATNN